jgi:hypothetical protein
MKRADLIRKLEATGCLLIRHGGSGPAQGSERNRRQAHPEEAR